MIEKIGAREARQMIEAGEAAVVDVRPAQLFAMAHIPGALSLPEGTFDEQDALRALPDKSAPVIVYCQVGVLSEMASARLDSYGYEQVLDMGGIVAWPYETTAE